jgi:hypothetical protein
MVHRRVTQRYALARKKAVAARKRRRRCVEDRPGIISDGGARRISPAAKRKRREGS